MMHETQGRSDLGYLHHYEFNVVYLIYMKFDCLLLYGLMLQAKDRTFRHRLQIPAQNESLPFPLFPLLS